MNKLGMYAVQAFVGDNLVDHRGGIIAQSKDEAYATAVDEMEQHQTFTVHWFRDATPEEIKEFNNNETHRP